MVRPPLPSDDLPPQELELVDHQLRRRLDQSLTERFQQQCDVSLQDLLALCDWSVTTTANVVTLVIVCPDRPTNWKVLNYVVPLGNIMATFSKDAKLRIYATPDMVDLFEIRVDELSSYPKPI
ncbi:MAG: hypothetical protein AAFY26_06545 [Cyanobacteria bacterium J06638_22]